MGCAQSRVDNEEAVARCKERRNVIKEAVAASKAFAAGHFAYAIALKNTGAALSDYGHGESDQPLDVMGQQHFQQQANHSVDPAPQPPPPPPIENLPPPPPPLPKFSPSPIKRAISLPTMAVRGRKLRTLDSVVIEEEGEEDEEDEEEVVKDGVRSTGREEEEEQSSPRTPENVGNNGRKRPETPEIVSASPANSMAWDYFFMVENMPGPNLEDREMGNSYETQNNHFQFNEEEEDEVEERSGIFRKNSGHKATEEMELKTPEKVEEVEQEEQDEDEEEEEEDEEEEEEEEAVAEAKKKKKGKAKVEHSKTAPPEFRRAVAKTTASTNVNLMKILDEIDDRFLKASECAQEVSKMLEATRLHYHSNFADNRGIELVSLLLLFGFLASRLKHLSSLVLS